MSLDQAKKILDSSLSKRKVFVDALFSRPESLSKLLPYDEYIEDSKVFQLKDGSLGALFQLKLKEHETCPESQVIKSVDSLKPFFLLPESCVVQFLYDQAIVSHLDSVFKDLEEEAVSEESISGYCHLQRISRFKDNCKSQNADAILDRKLYVSVRYFPKQKKGSLRDMVDSSHRSLGRELAGYVKELKNFTHILKELESNSELEIQQVSAESLLGQLRHFFNPQTFYKRSFAPFNSKKSLSQQFLYNSPVLSYEGVKREGKLSRAITLKTSPQYAYPGGMAYFTKLKFPFKLSLNFSFPTKAKVKKFFDFKEFFLQNSISAKARYQKEEIEQVQDRLAREDRCLHMTFTVIVEGDNEDQLDERVRSICNIFHNKLECEVIVENDIGCGLILNSLPLAYTPDSDYSAQRFVRILRTDAQNFIPIFDTFKGMNRSTAIYSSRERALAPFSLLETTGPQHTSIMGGTPKEQTILVNELITSHKKVKDNPLVFVVDKGSRHKMIAQYFDADITVFGYNEELPFTPFRGKYDKEKIAFLTNLICSAVELTSPNFTIESEHKSAISKAIKNAYLSKCKKSGLNYVDGQLLKQESEIEVLLQMEDIAIELGSLSEKESESIREIVDPLLLKLKPFYQDGVYSKFFKGVARKKESKNDFYLYDLEALSGDKVIQTLLTMSVTEEIRRILSLEENRGRTSFLVIKDFEVLSKNNSVFQEYVNSLSSMMADKGCRLITMSTNPESYFESATGRTFLGTSDNLIFLPLPTDQVDYLNSKSSLFDEANTEIVRSLKSSSESLEFFYLSKDKKTQGAYLIDLHSFNYWMASETARDVRQALKALEEGKSSFSAFQKLASKVPDALSRR